MQEKTNLKQEAQELPQKIFLVKVTPPCAQQSRLANSQRSSLVTYIARRICSLLAHSSTPNPKRHGYAPATSYSGSQNHFTIAIEISTYLATQNDIASGDRLHSIALNVPDGQGSGSLVGDEGCGADGQYQKGCCFGKTS
ncbi:hypothetical protein ACHAXS_007789 [Conticribra weissflogii]